jgi:predicted ferric reductase
MRLAGWSALFSALVAAPMLGAVLSGPVRGVGFAFEFGAAAGWVAFGLLAAQFALVTRVRSATAAVGSDALLLFHRLMAWTALGFLALHVLLLAPRLPDPFAAGASERSGAIAAWTAALLVLTAVLRRRLRVSYEVWLSTHRSFSIVVVIATAWHVHSALGPGQGLARAIAWTCCGAALAALATQRVLRPLTLLRRPWEIVENRDEGADTRTLVLRAIGHDGLRFAAGQFVWISTPRAHGVRGLIAEEHPITIASSPEHDGGRTLELAIKALGDWSRDVVPELRVGERVRIDGPFGAFSYEDVPAQRLVLIAGGIGITPMRSMLLAMRDRGDTRKVELFFAAHDRSRAMFAAELERLRGELDLRVVFVLESPGPGDGPCERGRVTAELLRRHLPAELHFTHVFVCGPPPMVASVEAVTAELGIPARNVHTERFDLI